MQRIYLDYAATTPTDPEVVAAMQPYYSEMFGNPSSVHSFGQEAKSAVEKAREQVAALIGSRPEEIIFTSGGTEADNQAIKGIAFAHGKPGDNIIVSAIEHHAVTESAEFLEKQGFHIVHLPVDHRGLVDPQHLADLINERTLLVSIMHANNEIGTIQPIAEISEVVGHKVFFHTDAVQSTGHLPIKVDELGVDLLSLSAHKFYGPKGVGALYVRKGVKLTSLLHGGGQERKRRASTENVPGIVGLGQAAEMALGNLSQENSQLIPLRDALIKGILERVPDSQLNGDPEKRLANNVNVAIKYVEGEAMLLNLDLQGIAASSGSACTSGSVEPSHVLTAIGLLPEIAHGSLRFSLGKATTREEIDRVLTILPEIVLKLRQMSPLYRK